MPVPYCFNYCSFVVESEVREHDSSSSVLSQDCFGSVCCHTHLKNIYILKIYLAVLGLSCGTWDLSLWRVGSLLWHTGLSLVVVHGLSSCGVQALERMGSVVAVHGLSCLAARGIIVP